ncbi:hypothetical protein F4861DRAFT_492215 [Xylaria intraflava]|nr:hypothetical protein F4861DRAFT_492215 [Xylaria intraflava]
MDNFLAPGDEDGFKIRLHRLQLEVENIVKDVCQVEEPKLDSDAIKEAWKAKLCPVVESLVQLAAPAYFINEVLEKTSFELDGGEEVFVTRRCKVFLLETAVPLDWSQLGHQNPQGIPSTPLHKAIETDRQDRKRKHSFLSVLCHLMERGIEEGTLPKKMAAAIIAKTNDKDENCLHLALMQDLDVAERLIRMADEATFMKQRGNGNTPLHDALDFPVDKARAKQSIHPYLTPGPIRTTMISQTPTNEFARSIQALDCSSSPTCCKRCGDEYGKYRRLKSRRLKIIYGILQKCPLALAVHNDAGMSPFSHHIMGREEFRRQYPDFNKTMRPSRRGLADKGLGWVDHETRAANSRGGVNIQASIPAVERETPASIRRSSLQPSHKLTRTNTGSPTQGQVAEQISDCSPDIIRDYYQLSCEIERMLWEEAFRLEGGYDKACQCLFSSDPRQEGHSGVSGGDNEASGPKLTNRAFTPLGRITSRTVKVYKHWTFEPMMTYVHLKLTPNIKRDGIPKDWARLRAQSSIGLLNVFKWLTEVKGVKRILKLVVEDNAEWPCSETTIRDCLRRLEDIRYLNWKRPNISVETLLVAPNIVGLWLYSTGINAVLAGWADKEGLQQLKKLRMVKLDAKMGHETEEANETNVKNFEAKLSKWYEGNKDNAPKIDKILEKAGSGDKRPQPGCDSSGGVPLNGWLLKARKLTNQLGKDTPSEDEEVRLDLAVRVDVKAIGLIRPRDFIKVALLDDGVDPESGLGEFMSGTGWPVASGPAGDEAPPAPFYSTGQEQHGNRMARLITDVCPFVRLYVAKMSGQTNYEGEVPHPTFRVEDAVKAIDWAIKQKVEVISMSWNLWLEEDKAAALKSAIQRAHKSKILLFCAASENKPTDSGKANAWPTNCSETFSIGAASDTRAAKDYVGSDADYLFPSDRVLEDVSDGRNSAATALAAGLASLILFSLKSVERETEENTRQKNQTGKAQPTGYVKRRLHTGINPRGTILNIFTSLTRVNSRYVDINALADGPSSFGTIAEYCERHVE